MKNAKKIILGTSLFLALGASSASAETYELWAKGVSESGGWVDFNKTYSNTNDNDLCWAAAASNIINWWQKQYKIPEYVPKGEEIWNRFKHSFTDDGSNPLQAFYWWFDGSYSPPSTNAAKLKSDAAPAAYYPYERCIDAYMGQYDMMCDFIIDSLTNGCGITLGLSFGHEVTLWGIEYNSSSNDITKLWLTDSDDNQKGINPGGIFSVDCYKYTYPYGESYLGIEGYWGTSAGYLVYARMATVLEPSTILLPIPEPSAFGLLAGLGALALVASRRRRK